jgi:hypothetical protein
MATTSTSELRIKFQPLAEGLHALTEPLSQDEALPHVQRLAALTGQAAHLVGYLLQNDAEGRTDSAATTSRFSTTWPRS